MPYPFIPATTSHLVFQTNFISTTHPSLPAATTNYRNVLRSALKSHKRLSPVDQANNLPNLLACLTDYLRYLNTINAALSGKPVSGEEIDLALAKEVEVEWRPTLSSSAVPGKEADRVKGRGLDYEIYFVYHTLAISHNLTARQSLLGLYAAVNPTSEQRVAMIQTATKALRTTSSLHTFLTQSSSSSDGPPTFPASAIDIQPSIQSSLTRLASAEINLLAVLKDDPYPALLIQSRNATDREWMIKAPTIPKVRAQVLTRLCIGAADHAAAASASLKVEGRKVLKELVEYTDDLRRTARARACRFQALDADLAGSTGKAIAWLQAAFNELGIEVNVKDGGSGSTKASKLDRLKSSWNERKEDKRIARADPRWGIDGGKSEEGRILEYLERKFSKANNTINIQVVPDWRPLMTLLPGGMNLPIDERWKASTLTEEELSSMRAPIEVNEDVGESSGEDEEGNFDPRMAGAFPSANDDREGGNNYY